MFRACQPDGQMRPPTRQVHGLLHALQGRRRAQGRQRSYRRHQDQEEHTVRGLVSDWFQGNENVN